MYNCMQGAAVAAGMVLHLQLVYCLHDTLQLEAACLPTYLPTASALTVCSKCMHTAANSVVPRSCVVSCSTLPCHKVGCGS